jgi:hypothetical protein
MLIYLSYEEQDTLRKALNSSVQNLSFPDLKTYLFLPLISNVC